MNSEPTPGSQGTQADSPASASQCVICNAPISGRVYRIGDRSYCAEHYAYVMRPRGTWPAVWLLFIVLIGVGLLAQQAGTAVSPLLTGKPLVIIGIILAILPALIWLLVFRQLDRLEPERFQLLVGVMVIGALIAGAIGEPLIRDVFGLPLWSESRWQWAIPIYALTEGVVLALTIYFAVRFSVFLLAEFDERADGIIYGTAAGLGAAVFYNLRYLLDAETLRLDVGIPRVIIAALVFASVGGLVGYGLGQVRFEHHSVWYLPGIIVLAALLTGIYDWLASEAISRSLGYTAWISLLVAAAFGLVLFGAINFLVRSAVRETLVAPQSDAAVAP
jgi:RsiW-degrading membrane proteinase PrsW (M82 family)